jgi:hypothetical protein
VFILNKLFFLLLICIALHEKSAEIFLYEINTLNNLFDNRIFHIVKGIKVLLIIFLCTYSLLSLNFNCESSCTICVHKKNSLFQFCFHFYVLYWFQFFLPLNYFENVFKTKENWTFQLIKMLKFFFCYFSVCLLSM